MHSVNLGLSSVDAPNKLTLYLLTYLLSAS